MIAREQVLRGTDGAPNNYNGRMDVRTDGQSYAYLGPLEGLDSLR